jgi:micrococcal nuclease
MPIPAILLAASFALCAPGPRTTCVVDGDTFWLSGEKIRIADINAPETHGAGCPSEQARGGRSLGEQLVAEGLAERWQGRRGSWC